MFSKDIINILIINNINNINNNSDIYTVNGSHENHME